MPVNQAAHLPFYRRVPTIVWVAAGALFILVVWPTLYGAMRPEAVKWRTDYAAARADALAAHRPVLIDFYATWCGPCQQMIGDTWSDKSVAAAVNDYVRIRVDIDKNPDAARGFGVEAIPTMVILDGAGNPVKQYTGYLGPAELLQWLPKPPPAAGAVAMTH